MVKQGSIIKISFDPQLGHEQAGFRPAVVVSNTVFNEKTTLVLACPITNTVSNFPLHVRLDSRTAIKGEIMCEQIKALDLNARTYTLLEQLPHDLLLRTIEIIQAEVNIV